MPLDTRALTTTSIMETVLGITPDSQDDLLERLIMTATRQIERVCLRQFSYGDDITEKVKGTGRVKLYVARAPLTEIISIVFAGSTLSSGDYEIDGDGLSGEIYFPGGTVDTAAFDFGGISGEQVPGTERRRYTINYKGGWITPEQDEQDDPTGSSGNRNLPEDVEQAAIELVTIRYRQMGQPSNIASERTLSTQVTYSSNGSGGGLKQGIPESIYGMVEPYILPSLL